MTFLLDANSIFFILRSSQEEMKSRVIQDAKILDLTYYEVGNAIWKDLELTGSLSEEDLLKLTAAIEMTLSNLERVHCTEMELSGILETARRERLTFYDSSYVHVAKKNNITLVTEDRKLARVAKKYVKTLTVDDLIASD